MTQAGVFALAASALLLSGGCSNDSVDPPAASSAASTCSTSAALAGARYDLAKSKFAFGSTPTPEDAGSLVRDTGSDGVVAIFADGSELASMNAGASESDLPDWSRDMPALQAHSVAYWESMGVQMCQIAQLADGGASDFTSSSSGSNTPILNRSIDGIVVAESLAYARFDSQDQTTSEGFYWPTIPADVVVAASAFRSQLATLSGLRAYQAKLPADAHGPGTVRIHHSAAGSSSAFQAVATYDVYRTGDTLGGAQMLSFDSTGTPVGPF